MRIRPRAACRAICGTFALGIVTSSCDATPPPGEFRQGSASYQFIVSAPATPPDVQDVVTYQVFVRDRKTGQPVENGEGGIFARAGAGVEASLVKAPQVGQYTGTLRFPNDGDWTVGIRFHDNPAKALERIQWMQQVGHASASATPALLAHPWPWRTAGQR